MDGGAEHGPLEDLSTSGIEVVLGNGRKFCSVGKKGHCLEFAACGGAASRREPVGGVLRLFLTSRVPSTACWPTTHLDGFQDCDLLDSMVSLMVFRTLLSSRVSRTVVSDCFQD